MSINHFGELLIRLEPLPLQLRAPILEEPPRPCFARVVPKLTEGLLQDVRSVEPLVRREQELEIAASRAAQVAHVRKQRVFLALRENFL